MRLLMQSVSTRAAKDSASQIGLLLLSSCRQTVRLSSSLNESRERLMHITRHYHFWRGSSSCVLYIGHGH